MKLKILALVAVAASLSAADPLDAADGSKQELVQGKLITYKFESKPFPSPEDACRALLLEHNPAYLFKHAAPRFPTNTTQWDCAYKDGENFGTFGTVEADLQCPNDSEPFEWTKRKLTCKCRSAFKASASQECEDPKVNDFKDAASRTGCEAIPYDDERKTCKELGETKDASCQKFECDKEGARKDLATLKERRANLEKAKARKSPEQIPKLESAIDALVTSLTERKKQASMRKDRCSACVTARENVQDHFKRVKQQVEGESDAKLQQYVQRLATHYTQGAADHVNPIEDAKRARENCEWVEAIKLDEP